MENQDNNSNKEMLVCDKIYNENNTDHHYVVEDSSVAEESSVVEDSGVAEESSVDEDHNSNENQDSEGSSNEDQGLNVNENTKQKIVQELSTLMSDRGYDYDESCNEHWDIKYTLNEDKCQYKCILVYNNYNYGCTLEQRIGTTTYKVLDLTRSETQTNQDFNNSEQKQMLPLLVNICLKGIRFIASTIMEYLQIIANHIGVYFTKIIEGRFNFKSLSRNFCSEQSSNTCQ